MKTTALVGVIFSVSSGCLTATISTATDDKIYSDTGYEKIWTVTSNENIQETCFPLDKALQWMNGSFLIPSVAQFELGDQEFTGSLDGFGKWHRFEFSNQGMCFQCRMLESGFYNKSMEGNKIIPEMIFADTTPSSNYTTMQRAVGPNDNNLVNSFQIGGHFRAVTDFIYYLELDPYNLGVIDTFKYTDKALIGFPLGSAHPLMRVDTTTNCVVNIEPYQKIAGSRGAVYIYETCEDKPNERRELNHYDSDYSPYAHSWGLTTTYVIVPHQTCYPDSKLMFKKNIFLGEAFQESVEDTVTIMLAPLDGSTPFPFEVEAPFYYTHIVNSFQVKNAVVFDVVTFKNCPFNGGILASRENVITPELRNSHDYAGVTRRYVLYTSGERQGQHDVKVISKDTVSTDFPRINDRYQGKPYCHYYAVENFHRKPDMYGSMAIVKQSICTPGAVGDSAMDVQQPVYWQKQNYFPGEPTFIPRDKSSNSAAEDDGILVFNAVEGETFKANMIVVNASTMETIQEIELPTAMTFTVHGQFYPGLVD